MRRALWGVAVLAGVAATAFACSGGGSCLQTALGSTCYSCLQSNCSSQLNAFQSDCSTYLSCTCPSGSFDPCAAESSSCQADESQSSCASSAEAVGTCRTTSCESQCSQADAGVPTCSSSSSGSSSGGLSSGSNGSSGSSGSSSGSNTVCQSTMACAGGQTLTACQVYSSPGMCVGQYYTVGSQMFTCNSCTDVYACAMAAGNACQ